MRNPFRSVAAILACALPLATQGNLLLEARLESAEERSHPLGVLYLEIDASEVRYSFWADPSFEPPGALHIEGGTTVRSLHLGEGRMARFDYDSFGGNHVPENPFLRPKPIDGNPELVPVDGGFPDMRFMLTHPALTQWMEYSGAIDDSELANFLGSESGLSAMMGPSTSEKSMGPSFSPLFPKDEGT